MDTTADPHELDTSSNQEANSSVSEFSPIISSTNTPQQNLGKKVLIGLISLLLLIALPVGLYLSQQSQDTRQRAHDFPDACYEECLFHEVEEDYCRQFPACPVCYEICVADPYIDEGYCDTLPLCTEDFASPTPTPTLFPTVTPTPLATPSPTPSLVPSPTLTPTPTPTPTLQPSSSPIVGAQCVNIKLYQLSGPKEDPDAWELLTSAQIAGLQAGDTIYVTTQGTLENATITRARIRVNQSTWLINNETINTKPCNGSCLEEWYITYTLPTGILDFKIESEVYSPQFDDNTNPSDGPKGWR